MRRVLWLAKGLGPGGMERLLLAHASVADRNRFEYFAAYLVERPHSVVGDLEGLGVRCTRFGVGRGIAAKDVPKSGLVQVSFNGPAAGNPIRFAADVVVDLTKAE